MQAHHAFLICSAILTAGIGALGPRKAMFVDEGAAQSGADQVIAFWRDAGPGMWFAKDPEFDKRFRDRFLDVHEAAARGDLDHWQLTAEGSLALVLLLDQFPRNSFRDTPRMYATDARARQVTRAAIEAKQDLGLDPDMRLFLYLPFGHSEDAGDQERSVELSRRHLRPIDTKHAEHHRDIIARFGRFPHRNVILGRTSTEAEIRYLDEGGFKG